jgi:hypothetical protein
MFWAYLKTILSLAIPLSTLLYAGQVRTESDIHAFGRDVRLPLNERLAATNPAEFLRLSRAETKYLRQLVDDL